MKLIIESEATSKTIMIDKLAWTNLFRKHLWKIQNEAKYAQLSIPLDKPNTNYGTRQSKQVPNS